MSKLVAYGAITYCVPGSFPRKFPQMLCILTGISLENFRNIEPELLVLRFFINCYVLGIWVTRFLSSVMCLAQATTFYSS